MHLLFVTPYYLPDGGPSAPLYTMLCEALAQKGHQVTVISAVPHYPTGRVLPDYRQRWIKSTHEAGVNVIRVPLPSMDRTNLTQRFIQLTLFQFWALLSCIPIKVDAIVMNNPFFMVGLPYAFLSVFRKKPMIYSIHDVYPDVGIQLGVFRSESVIKIAATLERFCLDRAAYVRILSESFIPAMHSLGVPDSKLVLIYDWVDTELIKPLTKVNDYSKTNGLSEKFVVLYAGNIGLSQGLEKVLEAAKVLENHPDIVFVFVGEGAGRADLISRAEQLGLKNVQFFPFQPRECLPHVLATADVSLVTLQKGMSKGSLPSKSYSILASGRPIIASVDQDSDMAKLVSRAGAGLCLPPEDPLLLSKAVLELKNEPSLCQKFGENGRLYALRHHSPQAAASQFEDLLKKVVH